MTINLNHFCYDKIRMAIIHYGVVVAKQEFQVGHKQLVNTINADSIGEKL